MRRAAIVFAMLSAVAACGPSLAEMRTAQATRYHVAPEQLMQIVVDTTRETYKIESIDAVAHTLSTVTRYYGPDGDLESAGAGGTITMVPNTFGVTIDARVVETDDHAYAIQVTARTLQLISGSPKPRELGPDDPYVPGWVHGRVDALAYAIYERAKPFAVAAH